MLETVVIKKCGGYELEKVKKALEEGFELLGGLDKFIGKDEKVLLKVNSLFNASVEKAVCTHPVMLQAVIQLVKRKTKNIYVGDSPAVGSFSFCAKKNGMLEVIRAEGVNIAGLSKEEYALENKSAIKYRSFKVDGFIKAADKIISLPKFKTHGLMYMTLAVKNMFGIIPGTAKAGYHLRAGSDKKIFAEMLVDLYMSRPPDLNILDGVIGMEGNGPGGGNPVNTGVILMAKDGFAMDFTAPKIAGIDPNLVLTNAVYKEHILKGKEIDIEIKGEKLEDVIYKGFLPVTGPKSSSKRPGFLINLAKNLITPKQVYLKEKCTGCLTCVKACPVKALSYEKGKGISCDYGKCIRCFICQEICPEQAIVIKKQFLSLFIK